MNTEVAHLSIVIPAYNEALRLPKTLQDLNTYTGCLPFLTEVIVVDDGSDDGTAEIASIVSGIQVIRLDHRGKGFAVRAGALKASGKYILLCDADLSTPLSEWEKLYPFFAQGYDIVVGSREGTTAQRIGEPWYRHLMGRVFNSIVRSVLQIDIQDTQCGFKALKNEVAKDVFSRLRIYGDDAGIKTGPAVTAYDVELLFLAKHLGYQIKEVPVIWTYGIESKVNPLNDSLRNFRDVLTVRMNQWRGLYSHEPCIDVIRKGQA